MNVISKDMFTFVTMRRSILFLVVFLFASFFAYAKKDVPGSFIENKGQWPNHVLYASDVKGGKIFVEHNSLKYHFFDLSAIEQAHNEGKVFLPNDVRIKGHVYEVQFLGCNEVTSIKAFDRQQTYYNYFLGQDESKWAGNCHAFSKIERQDLYNGIDFKFYSTGYSMKYDFIVHPNADVSQIKMQYDFANKVLIEDGRLKIITSVNEIYEQKPIAWQIINGEKRMVDCRYQLDGNKLSFTFPKGYNKNHDLIIDPELIFSTYSGSFANNFGYTATYDSEGNLYSGGSTFGQGYPITTGAYQETFHGGHSTLGGIDMGLTKYDASGTLLVWSTYLGGNGDDLPHSIVVNNQAELFVYGTSGSNNYPITAGAIDNSFNGGTATSSSGTGANFPNGSDIVVTRFNQAASDLLGSTYIGGSSNDGLNLAANLKYNYADEFRGEISLDSDGNPLIVSSTLSANFPMQSAFQNSIGGLQDGVAMKLTSSLNQFFWSSFLGGSLDDSGFSIAENDIGEIYICGGTSSSDFLNQNNTLQITNAGGMADGFVIRLSSNGQSILSCTYWGSSAYDQLYFIEVDTDQFVYVFGQTRASGSTMIMNAAYGIPDSGNLLTKFSADLSSVIWSSVFGTGNTKPNLSPSAFLVDYCNRIYISGWGITQVAGNALNPNQNLHSMAAMPTTSDAFDNTCTTGDFYMAVFDENMSMLEYATFFGGNQSSEHVDGGTSRFDRKGVIYQSVCAGCGGFDDFPIAPSNAWSAQNNNNCNNGVYKFDFQLPLTIADFEHTPVGCVNAPIQFTSTSTFAQTYSWSFGDESTSSSSNPTHEYDEPGVYTVMLAVFDNTTCNSVDTIYKTITIQEAIVQNLDDLNACEGESFIIGLNQSNPEYEYSWSPSQFLSNPNISNPVFTAGASTDYTLTVQREGCVDTYYQTLSVTELAIEVPSDTTLCDEGSVILVASVFPSNASIEWSDENSFGNILNDNPQDVDIEISPAIPTIYYVRITSNACTLVDEVFVNLVSFQTVIQGDFTACMGDTVSLSVLDPNPEFEYSWQPANLVIAGQNTSSIEAVVMQETTFTVSSETEDGCVATDDVIVQVSQLNSQDVITSASPTYIISGQSSLLNAEPDGYGYSWTPISTLNSGAIQSPIATPLETTTYYVTVSDGECIATKSVTVYVTDFVCGEPTIYVPNTFTPNADNKNEKLYVRANNIDDLYFVIYDRWGEKVFETKNIYQGWDGSLNGRKLDPDVYVFYLEATCIGGEEYFHQGNITLIR